MKISAETSHVLFDNFFPPVASNNGICENTGCSQPKALYIKTCFGADGVHSSHLIT
jgi:hypothetical protein